MDSFHGLDCSYSVDHKADSSAMCGPVLSGWVGKISNGADDPSGSGVAFQTFTKRVQALIESCRVVPERPVPNILH